MTNAQGFLATPSRRSVLMMAAGAMTLAALGEIGWRHAAHAAVPFELPPLPYAEDALAPVISPTTIAFHYGKHHRGYVETVNKLATAALAAMTLDEIVLAVAGDPDQIALFNAAAQASNHTLYWDSMRPNGGGRAKGELLRRIEADFGSWETFHGRFVQAAMGQFGSGWAWLAAGPDGALEVIATSNADTPLVQGWTPLLTIDVWEHAYYLDYQNRRADYVKGWLESLANWDFAEEQYGKARL